MAAAGIADDMDGYLFQSCPGKTYTLTDRRLSQANAWYMIRYYAKKAGINKHVCCHSFRGSGITTFLNNGGELEKAQHIAAHSSPNTTRTFYFHGNDELDIAEIERTQIKKAVVGL